MKEGYTPLVACGVVIADPNVVDFIRQQGYTCEETLVPNQYRVDKNLQLYDNEIAWFFDAVQGVYRDGQSYYLWGAPDRRKY